MKKNNLKIKYVFAAIMLAGLVLGTPMVGQAAAGNLTITLKSVAALGITQDISWEMYNRPYVKEEVNAGTLWNTLSTIDPSPRKTIIDIPLVGSAADGLVGAAMNVLKIDIDPSKTDNAICFKVPTFTDECHKAENKDFTKEILGVTFSFKIVFGGASGSGSFENPLQADTFQELVERLINFAFVVSLVLAPLMVLIAGLVWLTAGGRPDAIASGRNILYWTLIGFTIVLLARGLIAVLKSILGG